MGERSCKLQLPELKQLHTNKSRADRNYVLTTDTEAVFSGKHERTTSGQKDLTHFLNNELTEIIFIKQS